jgi:predicted Zn-dependent peptidase
MKKILIILMIVQGVLLSSSISDLKIGDVNVPLIYEKDDNLPIITMQVVFKNGGSLSDGNLSGVARISAKILNEGTKKLGSVGFASALEDSAIHLDVNIGKETLVIELSALKEKFKEGVGLLRSLLKDPNLSKESFEKIKLLSKATIERKASDFDFIASTNLKSLIYKGTPLQYPSIGTLDSLNKIKLDDVSEFIKNHLVLSEAIIISGGDLSQEDASLYAKEVLEVLKKGKASKLKQYKPTNKAENIEVYKDTKQAFIYFGSPYDLSVDDKDRYKSRVAMFILGSGGFGSRLMEEIRVKRGLAYSAYSRAEVAKSHSHFSGYLQTKLESKDEAIKIVKDVIAEFVKNGISKDELDQAKKFILGSEPLRNETLSQRLSTAFQEYYNGFKLGHSKDELKLIEKLTLDDLNKFIKSHKEINSLSFSVVTKK